MIIKIALGIVLGFFLLAIIGAIIIIFWIFSEPIIEKIKRKKRKAYTFMDYDTEQHLSRNVRDIMDEGSEE